MCLRIIVERMDVVVDEEWAPKLSNYEEEEDEVEDQTSDEEAQE